MITIKEEKMRIILFISIFILLGITLKVEAGERVDHFEGKPANTLEEAVSNFSEYNKKLNDILNKEDISGEDMFRIHQLTYTIENALQKINEEVEAMAVSLENLHISSETGDLEGIKKHGAEYISSAKKLVK